MIEEKYIIQEPSKTMNITENKEDMNQLVKDAQELKFPFDGKISRK